MAVEESGVETQDVGAVNIRVCHENNTMIAEFIVVGLVPYPRSNGDDKIFKFVGVDDLVQAGPLGVEDFAKKRKDGLKSAVTAIFGAAAGGGSFDHEKLGFFGVSGLTIGEFAGEGHAFQGAFSQDCIFGGPGR